MSESQLRDFPTVVDEVRNDPIQRNLLIATTLSYGGSFFKALAAALQHADPNNFGRLCEAFPELILNYGPGSNMYETKANALREQAQAELAAAGG